MDVSDRVYHCGDLCKCSLGDCFEPHEGTHRVDCGSFPRSKFFLLIFFGLFTLSRLLDLLMEDLNELISDGLLNLVKDDGWLDIEGLLGNNLRERVVVLDVKNVEVGVAGAVHPAEALVFRVEEDNVSSAIPIFLVNSSSRHPIEHMDSLSRVPDDVLGVLVEHSTVQVFVASSLGTLERGHTVLFKERNLVTFLEMLSSLLSLENFDYESLDGRRVAVLVIRNHHPELIVVVVHLSRAQVAIALGFGTDRRLHIAFSPVEKVVLRGPRGEVFLGLARFSVELNEGLVFQMARPHVDLAINADPGKLVVRALD